MLRSATTTKKWINQLIDKVLVIGQIIINKDLFNEWKCSNYHALWGNGKIRGTNKQSHKDLSITWNTNLHWHKSVRKVENYFETLRVIYLGIWELFNVVLVGRLGLMKNSCRLIRMWVTFKCVLAIKLHMKCVNALWSYSHNYNQ